MQLFLAASIHCQANRYTVHVTRIRKKSSPVYAVGDVVLLQHHTCTCILGINTQRTKVYGNHKGELAEHLKGGSIVTFIINNLINQDLHQLYVGYSIFFLILVFRNNVFSL